MKPWFNRPEGGLTSEQEDRLAAIREGHRVAQAVRISNGDAFRDYERPDGIRGDDGVREYRVSSIWDGRVVDELFTFSRQRADEMVQLEIDQAYDVALYDREAGGWRLIQKWTGSLTTRASLVYEDPHDT